MHLFRFLISFTIGLTFSFSLLSQPHQPVRIFGKVIDAKSSKPIIKAHIFFSHQSTVLSTDQYGKFTLDIDKLSPKDTIYISFTGYASTSIPFSRYHRPGPLIIKLTPQNQPTKHSQIATLPTCRHRFFYSHKSLDDIPLQLKLYPQSTPAELANSLYRCLLAGRYDYIKTYLLAFPKRKYFNAVIRKKTMQLSADSLHSHLSFFFNTLALNELPATPASSYHIILQDTPYTIVSDSHHRLRLVVDSSWLKSAKK